MLNPRKSVFSNLVQIRKATIFLIAILNFNSQERPTSNGMKEGRKKRKKYSVGMI
jgi:hypothetical protein